MERILKISIDSSEAPIYKLGTRFTQGDSKSHFLEIEFKDEIDFANKKLKVNFIRADDVVVTTIQSQLSKITTIEVPPNALSVAGELAIELVVLQNDKILTVNKRIKLRVIETTAGKGNTVIPGDDFLNDIHKVTQELLNILNGKAEEQVAIMEKAITKHTTSEMNRLTDVVDNIMEQQYKYKLPIGENTIILPDFFIPSSKTKVFVNGLLLSTPEDYTFVNRTITLTKTYDSIVNVFVNCSLDGKINNLSVVGVEVNVDENVGIPNATGVIQQDILKLNFKNLKGIQGDKGDKGDKPIKGTDYYTQQEKEQFTTETVGIVKTEGNKVVEQIKSIVSENPATTNALTLSGKTRTEFENDIDTRIKYNSKTEIIVKPETKIEFINKEQTINPSNGELVTLANYSVSDYIDLQDVFGIYRTGSEDKFNLWPYAFYDKDKKNIKYVKETTEYNIVDYNDKKVTWLTLEPSAKYVRVVFEDSRTMFTYYVVRNVKKITSYDVPKLTFDGEDILPQIPNGTNALEKVDSITEYIHQENILNPNKLTDKGYYFDFTDGVKKVEGIKRLITEEYIPFSNPNIYIRQQGADEIAPNAIFLIYCYNEEKYLGYISIPFEEIADTSYKILLKQDTTKIRLYVNDSRIKSNSICLSSNELEKFYPYQEVLRLKDKMFSNIAEIISENNILNPELLSNKGYYFDFTDGVKKIFSGSALIYEKYIPFEQPYIYIRQQGNETKNAIFLIYCYNEEKYLGYISIPFEEIADTSYKILLKQDTTKIRLYVNDSRIKSNSICLSSNELEKFYPYQEILKIEEKYLPEIKFYPFKNKTIANFGDSIFGNKRPPLDVSTALANITGATVYNLGFGGCRMSKHSTNWDAFSMYNLANSIADNNYSMQDSINITATGLPKYFEETRTLLKSIDWLKVDIVTIAYGTNDFTASVNLDSDINKSDTTTFAGALRYSIEKLLGKYPHLKIFICTPTYRFWIGSQNEFIEDSDTKVVNGVKLTDFVAKVKEVAKEYHLTSIDNYYELGINKFNRSKWFPVNDGTHHNPDGGVLLAEHIAKELF